MSEENKKVFTLDDRSIYPPYSGPADEPLPDRPLTDAELNWMMVELFEGVEGEETDGEGATE